MTEKTAKSSAENQDSAPGAVDFQEAGNKTPPAFKHALFTHRENTFDWNKRQENTMRDATLNSFIHLTR